MHHHIISTFVMFMLGQLIHAWQRASETVNSKLNGITSYDEYIHLRASEISGRILLVTCLFGGWASGGLYVLVSYIAPSTGASLTAHPLPVVWWTAGIIGYFGDAILYFFIGLVARVVPDIRKDIPPTYSSIIQKEIDAAPKA
jgi:hypothetical protein